MPIVDFHVHVEYKNIEKLERYSPQEILDAMNKGGIDISVILGIDQACFGKGIANPWVHLLPGAKTKKGWLPVAKEFPSIINFEDQEVSEFCKVDPKRLVGFASVHPDEYRPDLKIEWAVNRLGLRGVKLYPHSGFYPNDRRLDRFYQKCVDLKIPVVIHTGIKALRTQYMKFNRPIFVDDVLTNFPDLDVVMCHGGFPWTDEFLVVAYSNPNVWVDITFLDYIERTFKRPGYAEQVIRQLVDLVGVDHILWGSEGPFTYLPLYGKHGPEHYRDSMNFLVYRFDFLSDNDKAKILGENAVKLLRLD